MPDLVDYLREKLEHSDDVTCTCPDVEITTWLDPEPVFTKGLDRRCPVHGNPPVVVWVAEMEAQ